MTAKPICSGSETFISFLTPESDVKVEEPVKFIARKEDTAVIINNQDIISKILLPVIFIRNKITEMMTPEVNPLSEKLLPGIYGRNAGIITTPEK